MQGLEQGSEFRVRGVSKLLGPGCQGVRECFSVSSEAWEGLEAGISCGPSINWQVEVDHGLGAGPPDFEGASVFWGFGREFGKGKELRREREREREAQSMSSKHPFLWGHTVGSERMCTQTQRPNS